MRCYLGLDGGGTKTAAAIVDESGREVGRGMGGPCNIATADDSTVTKSIAGAAEYALESAGLPANTRFEAACAGVAGYTSKSRRADFTRLLRETIPARTYRVEPDYVIAYWGAAEGKPGIIAIAGTGAAVYGRNARGESARADGRGYLLGDHGSGFRIALTALRMIIRAEDNREPQTALSLRILNSIGASDGDDVVEWLYRDFSPARAASLVKVIAESAGAGDEDARSLIARAAIKLAVRSVEGVARRLGMEEEIQIYKAGGIWEASPVYEESFRRAIMGPDGDWDPPPKRLIIDRPARDAAYGAALLALNSSATHL